jgi:hypothetical protein
LATLFVFVIDELNEQLIDDFLGILFTFLVACCDMLDFVDEVEGSLPFSLTTVMLSLVFKDLSSPSSDSLPLSSSEKNLITRLSSAPEGANFPGLADTCGTLFLSKLLLLFGCCDVRRLGSADLAGLVLKLALPVEEIRLHQETLYSRMYSPYHQLNISPILSKMQML